MANVSESNDFIWGELQIRLPKNILEGGGANQNEGCFKKIIPLSGEKFVVGRADGCNYQLMKKLVSSRHCYLKQEFGKVYIHDTSRNGTFINRTKKLSHGEYHILKDNDEIYLISKKGDPHTDFCLIFKSRNFNATSNIEPSNMSSDEPIMKRIKLEQIDGLTETCVTDGQSLSLNPAETVSDDDFRGKYPAVLIKNSPNQNDSDATIAYEDDGTPKRNRGKPLESDLEPATDSDSVDTLPMEGSNCNEVSDIEHGTPEKSGTEPSTSREVKKLNLLNDSVSSLLKFDIHELPDIDDDDDSSIESLNIPLHSNSCQSFLDNTRNELDVRKHTDVDGANVGKSVQLVSHNDINKGKSETTPSTSLRVKKELMELNMTDEITSNTAPNIIDTINAMDKPSRSEKNEGCNSAVQKEDLPKKDGMEETLQCSLCIDILHEPVCLQPCLHCYCAGCYSQWMEKSSCCPQCRVFVESVSKNHIVSNMVEEYLKANPEKKRNEGDIQRLNEANVITQDVMKFSKKDEKVPDYDDEDSLSGCSDNSSYDSEDFSLSFPGFVLRLPTSFGSTQRCSQCPNPTEKGKKGSKNSKKGAKNQSGASTDGNTQPSTSASNSDERKTEYVCSAKQVHISCQCCQELMPDRTNNRASDSSIPPQKCSLCFSTYCNLYFEGGCRNASCKGCLVLFKDLKFSDLELVRAINDNAVETRILLDYLASRNETFSDCFSECLASLDSGKFNLVPAINSKSIICHDCALRQLKNLFFIYRKQIPASLLPDEVKQRPDCYWGKNCRTQKHKMTHAERYNHICEQTRFNH